jgi:hypothetical protein
VVFSTRKSLKQGEFLPGFAHWLFHPFRVMNLRGLDDEE